MHPAPSDGPGCISPQLGRPAKGARPQRTQEGYQEDPPLASPAVLPDRATGLAIEVGAVSKRFGPTVALDQIELSVPPGQFVPQSPGLLPWRTVRANARLLTDVGRRHSGLSPAAVDELLEQVGLADFRHAYPHELSGGMQQRVALVRAFALDAPVLLMDEPFAALDEITRAEMRYLLVRLCEERDATVVFVTHSIAEAVMLSDRVIVMTGRPGRIEADMAIPLSRPRHPEQEERSEFFALLTALRRSLRVGAQR